MDYLRKRYSTKINAENRIDPSALDPEIQDHNNTRPSVRFGGGPLLFTRCVFLLSWIAQHTDVVPKVVQVGLVLVGTCYVVFCLLKFKRWNDEMRYVPRFALCAIAMAVELTTENFLVWVVSATDANRMKRVPGLQDNVELFFLSLSERSPLLRHMLGFRWANIVHFLGAAVGLSVSPLWDQVPYSGFGMMSRFLLTICLSRIVRTVCFLATVLPSPRPGCFMRRFPPTPDNWWEFVKIGFSQMKGTGGCNDLIFSGHCGIWVLTPLLYHSYYQGKGCWLLWLALFQTSLRDVLERQHYSVDMVLAVVIVPLIWRELSWVYPNTNYIRERPPNSPGDPISPAMAALVIAVLLVVVGFVVKSGS
ncbi:hypothetical protein BSKO_00442 [Bryopsis sp. KO-2023]|nr:hypothetical protein BSKO_00442 [Bryopsis sp. KO-2023]